MSDRETIVLRLDADMLAKLSAMADQYGISRNLLITTALEESLDATENLLKKIDRWEELARQILESPQEE